MGRKLPAPQREISDRRNSAGARRRALQQDGIRNATFVPVAAVASIAGGDVGPPRIGVTRQGAVSVELDGVDSTEMPAGAGCLGKIYFPAHRLQRLRFR